MIWLALIGVSLLCALWLIAPLFAMPKALDGKTEVGAYLDEIAQLESGVETLARKTQLERRVIAASSIAIRPKASLKVLACALAVFVIAGTAAIYAKIGTPDLSDKRQATQVMTEPSLEGMAAKLKARLDETPESVEGWILYARTLMTLEDFDGALIAYETASGLAPSEASIEAEVQSAKDFMAQREAAMSMTAQDRMAMIEGMVASLSQKLSDDPENTEGWIRLLTSRRILRQFEQGEQDVAAMRAHYAERPEEIERILEASQWGFGE